MQRVRFTRGGDNTFIVFIFAQCGPPAKLENNCFH
jgi:hypothetical protein